MPNAELKTLKVGTPRFSGLELMELVNAMYQSEFIDSDDKKKMTKLITNGMNTGDYTELDSLVAEQCLRDSSGNPFWSQMKEFLRKETKE